MGKTVVNIKPQLHGQPATGLPLGFHIHFGNESINEFHPIAQPAFLALMLDYTQGDENGFKFKWGGWFDDHASPRALTHRADAVAAAWNAFIGPASSWEMDH